ncbi:MAG TPA: hypothetical protein VMG10_11990 [Gemmataceae bacterium]|nr:hypothetical protein [Gemmataceae bacterium]
MSIGCKNAPDGTTCQEGKVKLRPGQEFEVFYPIPYASPPNLEISGDTESCEIIEQKADHFHIRYKGTLFANPCWKARGVKCLPPPGAAPTVVVTPPASPPPPPPPATNGPAVPLPAPTPVQTP